jgi:hypothetical protein
LLRKDAAADAGSSNAPLIHDLDLGEEGEELGEWGRQPEADTPQSLLWQEGLPILTMSGVPDRQARSAIGRWLKDTSNDAIRILGTLREAKEAQIFEFIPWVTASLQKGVPARSPRDQRAQRNADALAALMSLPGGRGYAN